MTHKITIILTIIIAVIGGYVLMSDMIVNSSEIGTADAADSLKTITMKKDMQDKMKLGAFSISLSVKDLAVSKVFYEKMGFVVHGGGMESNYLIMKNENALIGLFQDMFEGNILTFNPGWNENAENIEKFDDVRTIQKNLQNSGIELMTTAPDTSEGPAIIMFKDPDGNLILIDQHR
jgi:lactoylglutathione lyase